MRIAAGLIALMLAGALPAQVAGPALPKPARETPAQQAIAHVRAKDAPRAAPPRCRQTGGETLTVCGVTEGQRARAPLDDQGIRDGARTAIGELPSTAMVRFSNPVGQQPRTGLTLKVARGKTKVEGNGAK